MYRVLIADDEMPALRYTRNIIQQFCSQFQIVDAVISGEAALKVLQAQAIDLLITDISMHGMSGIELAQSAKKLQPDLHIVIISGYGEFEYAQGAIQAGVDEYAAQARQHYQNDIHIAIHTGKAGQRISGAGGLPSSCYRLPSAL